MKFSLRPNLPQRVDSKWKDHSNLIQNKVSKRPFLQIRIYSKWKIVNFLFQTVSKAADKRKNWLWHQNSSKIERKIPYKTKTKINLSSSWINYKWLHRQDRAATDNLKNQANKLTIWYLSRTIVNISPSCPTNNINFHTFAIIYSFIISVTRRLDYFSIFVHLQQWKWTQ